MLSDSSFSPQPKKSNAANENLEGISLKIPIDSILEDEFPWR